MKILLIWVCFEMIPGLGLGGPDLGRLIELTVVYLSS
jgi:hypothetical protein